MKNNMTLKERIMSDFLFAYKEKNMEKKNFLGVLKGEIENMRGNGMEVSDESVMGILKKMEKSLKTTDNEESKRELGFLEPYLPQMMSEQEIRDIIEQLRVLGINDIAGIMREFNTKYRGQADNSIVSRIARDG